MRSQYEGQSRLPPHHLPGWQPLAPEGHSVAGHCRLQGEPDPGETGQQPPLLFSFSTPPWDLGG